MKTNFQKFLFYTAIVFISINCITCNGSSTHRWAWGEQRINNRGGDSRLNVWKPNSSPGVFSLSQHWYVGGSDANKQTVEGGWQVYPDKYGTDNPVLFIFYTPDNLFHR